MKAKYALLLLLSGCSITRTHKSGEVSGMQSLGVTYAKVPDQTIFSVGLLHMAGGRSDAQSNAVTRIRVWPFRGGQWYDSNPLGVQPKTP